MGNPLRLFDTEGETVAQITTDGSTLKPFVNALRPVVGEARVRFTEDGLRARMVNPSNVVAIDLRVPAAAFDTYDLADGERAVGVNLKSFRHLIRRARMGSDDTLDLRVAERRMYASVSRGYDGTNVVTDDKIDLIDPDSVRQEPDMDFGVDTHTLTVEKDAFMDATDHAAATADVLQYGLADGDLNITAKDDTQASTVRVEDVAPADAEVASHMSESLLGDVLKAVKQSKADDLTVELGHAVPMFFHFDRHRDDELILTGTALQAPRVTSDDMDDL